MTQLDLILQEPRPVEVPAAAPPWVSSDLSRLPCLSIRQPWAWAILNVGKDIENRSWPTKFRGRFLIHAAKGCAADEFIGARQFIIGAIDGRYRNKGIWMPSWREMERGGVVGVAEICGCLSESPSKWFMGEYGFVLRNVKPLPFYPCRGSLGFFTLPLP
jgi:hypothetical protein